MVVLFLFLTTPKCKSSVKYRGMSKVVIKQSCRSTSIRGSTLKLFHLSQSSSNKTIMDQYLRRNSKTQNVQISVSQDFTDARLIEGACQQDSTVVTSQSDERNVENSNDNKSETLRILVASKDSNSADIIHYCTD